ncbi:MAG: MarR family transcriptional regulator [Chloroflexi bacterium]|nr:MarR family transcriptional regulator [Chloroflexota bacterium]
MQTTESASAEQIARELLTIIPRLNRIISRELRDEFGDDTTIVQMRVLGEIAGGPLTLSALARKREVSMQAASEHIQSLVTRGWVVRVADPEDRRQSLLHITDEGQARLTEVREHIALRFTPYVEQLAPHEAEAMHQGLLGLSRSLIDDD